MNCNITEIIEENPIYEFRFKSILMPPLLNKNPIEPLNMIINYLFLNGKVPIYTFENWFFETLSQQKGKCYNTWKILERSNFILATTDQSLRLTNDGIKYINLNNNAKKKLIAKNFSEAYIGFLEFLLICLEKGESEIKTTQLFIEWNKNLHCDFDRSIGSAKQQYANVKKYLYFLDLIDVKGAKIIPYTDSIKNLLKDLF